MATAIPGVPRPIPRDPKGTYADRIIGYSTDYYYYGGILRNFQVGKWGAWQGPQPAGAKVHLVEVWEDSGERDGILIHPSRHAFFWVPGATEKQTWHNKALHDYTDYAAETRADYVADRIMPGPPPTSSHNFHKDHRPPNWAEEPSAVNKLIGYTSENPISWSNGQAVTKNINAPRPSVYYTLGHLTTEHKKGLNMGWRTEVGKCLFFGNIPVPYIDYP